MPEKGDLYFQTLGQAIEAKSKIPAPRVTSALRTEPDTDNPGVTMKGAETTLQDLLSGQKTYLIPYFQRQYDWKDDNWKAIWEDVFAIIEANPPCRHFMGAIVTKCLTTAPQGVSSYLVIDGQQRLISLSLLLAALRDAAKGGNPVLAKKINSLYLINEYASGRDVYKMLPTSKDQRAYFSTIDGSARDHHSRIATAYRYFSDRIARFRESHSDGDLALLEQAIVANIDVVSILLGKEDNEYRIFESLNAKGMRLTQADLLRNFIFMSLPQEQQDEIYNRLWLPFQTQFRDHEGRLEDFFRNQLLCKGLFVRKSDVYTEWKSDLTGKSPATLISILESLSQESEFFLRLVDPQREPHAGVAERLSRLNRWGAETLYPFLLNVYRAYAAKRFSPEEFVDVLATIESFLVRRLFAGVPTNQLNKLFLALFRQLPTNTPIVEAVRTILSEPSRRWPTDDEFYTSVMRFPLYQNGRAEQRRLIIETFAMEYSGREMPDLTPLTIEHILPQNLTNEWSLALERSEGRPVHEFNNEIGSVLHTIGNLTLTGYNAELSNSAWPKKKEMLSRSNLPMNRELSENGNWGLAEIAARNKDLADVAVKLWPGPTAKFVRHFLPPTPVVPIGIRPQRPAPADHPDSLRNEFSVGNPPSLTFTKVTLILVNGENIDRSWRSLLNAVLRLASRKGVSFTELVQLGGIQLRNGQASDSGFSPVPGTDFSLQGLNSDNSFASAFKVAARIGVGFRVEFIWRDNEGATFPGRMGLLQYQPES